MMELFSGLAEGDRTAWIVVSLVVADAVALASLALSRQHSARARIVWFLIVVLIPLAGAIAWFALGRERRKPHLS